MRKLKHFHILGTSVDEALDEFNERSGGFQHAEADIVNIQVLPSTGRKIGTPKGTEEAKVEVFIFFWKEEQDATTATTHEVAIQNMAFDPEEVTVAPGDTVRWTNRMGMAHTVTADNGAFNSGPLAPNQTFSQVFSESGTVGYHCQIHPFMTGSVKVT